MSESKPPETKTNYECCRLELTCPQREQIRRFVFKTIVPSGAVASLLIFFLGFFVQQTSQINAERNLEQRFAKHFDRQMIEWARR